MTEDIRRTVEQAKSPDVSVTVTGPDFGPEALESFYDYTPVSYTHLPGQVPQAVF